MSRRLVALDRTVLLLLALLVLAASAALLVWGLGRWPGGPEQVDLSPLAGVPGSAAWPWALAVGGVLAVLVGLRSLVAHAYRPRVRQVTLASRSDGQGTDHGTEHGTGDGAGDGTGGRVAGRLLLDLPAAARAAAHAMEREPEVERARGHVVLDRGATVVELVARVDAGVDLDRVRALVDRTHEALAVLVPAGTAQLRVRLDVHRGRVEKTRVA